MPKAVSINIFRFLETLQQNNGGLDASELAKKLDWTRKRTAGVGRMVTRKGWAFYWRETYNLTQAGRELLASNPKLYKPMETM